LASIGTVDGGTTATLLLSTTGGAAAAGTTFFRSLVRPPPPPVVPVVAAAEESFSLSLLPLTAAVSPAAAELEDEPRDVDVGAGTLASSREYSASNCRYRVLEATNRNNK
jgi:hypothetical protein